MAAGQYPAAAAYLRERITAGAIDPRTMTVYEGLLEVLDPRRRVMRLQRESATVAKAAVAVQPERDRRAPTERRAYRERRIKNVGPPLGVERRLTPRRRSGRDRRNRG